MLHRELFPIDGREFRTPDGVCTARLVNNPDAAPSAGFSDQVVYMLEFSDGKALTLVLSDVGLEHDSAGIYRTQACQIVESWLASGGPANGKIDFSRDWRRR
jgi:hypothetical protein